MDGVRWSDSVRFSNADVRATVPEAAGVYLLGCITPDDPVKKCCYFVGHASNLREELHRQLRTPENFCIKTHFFMFDNFVIWLQVEDESDRLSIAEYLYWHFNEPFCNKPTNAARQVSAEVPDDWKPFKALRKWAAGL